MAVSAAAKNCVSPASSLFSVFSFSCDSSELQTLQLSTVWPHDGEKKKQLLASV